MPEELDRLRAENKEYSRIVSRIWELFGNPPYESLKGRSIYDLIITLQKDAARFAFAKTLVGQVITIDTFRELGADKLDYALDCAMTTEEQNERVL